jgi:hypothetical protein
LYRQSFGYCLGMRPTGSLDSGTAHATIGWYQRARLACEQFIFASMRYRTPWVDDELLIGIREARQWQATNPCPDASMGDHLTAILDTYEVMTRATVGQVMDLRRIVEGHIEAMDTWSAPAPSPPLPEFVAPSRRPWVIPATWENRYSDGRGTRSLVEAATAR